MKVHKKAPANPATPINKPPAPTIKLVASLLLVPVVVAAAPDEVPVELPLAVLTAPAAVVPVPVVVVVVTAPVPVVVAVLCPATDLEMADEVEEV
jgi:NAD/NADP transhydrogenase beta subunit